ncbi:KamA family protein [Pasteurella multocida]|nr:KamA family protein [Pasteurella multocida]
MHILTQNIAIREEQSWTVLLANAISDPKILLETLNLPTENVEQDLEARRLFPLRVPLPFVEKMQKGNPQDPLFFTSYEFS